MTLIKKDPDSFQLIPFAIKITLSDLIFEKYAVEEEDLTVALRGKSKNQRMFFSDFFCRNSIVEGSYHFTQKIERKLIKKARKMRTKKEIMIMRL